MLEQKNLLNVQITDVPHREVLEYIIETLRKREKKLFIVTPNPEMVVYVTHHQDIQVILNHAQISLCDGVGLQIAGTILGKPIKNRFPGTDFVKIFCESVNDLPITVGFLGGRRGVAENAAKCLKRLYPDLKVVLAMAGDPDKDTANAIVTQKERIDMLFVAFGFPKQEKWIYEHLQKLPIGAAISVGGAFDYLSGNVSRAPSFVRAVGFEWLYRLIRQPWRIKRQLALIEFGWIVVKARIFGAS